MNPANKDTKVSYSKSCFAMRDKEQRLCKGVFIKNIITHWTKPDILVDIGCSYGYITYCFVDHFRYVVGLDPDEYAVFTANDMKTGVNCTFAVAVAEHIPIANNTANAVIMNHIYEHVNNQHEMMEEIYRILKADGIGYFTATNKYCLFEPHYKIPFFSWFAPEGQNIILRIFRRTKLPYNIHLLSYNEILFLLSKKFVVHDITLNVIKNYGKLYPLKSPYMKKLLTNPIVSSILVSIAKLFFQVLPNYIFILEKATTPEKQISCMSSREIFSGTFRNENQTDRQMIEI